MSLKYHLGLLTYGFEQTSLAEGASLAPKKKKNIDCTLLTYATIKKISFVHVRN